MKKAFFWALMLAVSMTACKGGKTENNAATEEKEPAVGLAIDEASFPDAALRGVIAQTSAGDDGILTDEEIDDFWLLDVSIRR